VVVGSLSPVWNERFRFRARPSSTLKLTVWNHRKTAKGGARADRQQGLLGSATVDLGFLAHIQGALPLHCEEVPLVSPSGEPAGDVFIEFRAHVLPPPSATAAGADAAGAGAFSSSDIAVRRSRSTSAAASAQPASAAARGEGHAAVARPLPRARSASVRVGSVPAQNAASRHQLSDGHAAEQRAVGDRGGPAATRTGRSPSSRPSRDGGDTDAPFPAGWEVRVTPAGRTYYANPRTRKTTWVRPVASRAAPTEGPRRRTSREEYERRSLLAGGVDVAQPRTEVFGFPRGEACSPLLSLSLCLHLLHTRRGGMPAFCSYNLSSFCAALSVCACASHHHHMLLACHHTPLRRTVCCGVCISLLAPPPRSSCAFRAHRSRCATDGSLTDNLSKKRRKRSQR
jgi:hypothetical protein